MEITHDQLFEILQVTSVDAVLRCSIVCSFFHKNSIYEFLWKIKSNSKIDVRLIKMWHIDSYLGCYDVWYQMCRVKSGLKFKNSVYKLYMLQKLYLSGIKINEIPKEICQLHNLQNLDLHYNRISEIPKEICQLHNLCQLYLSKKRYVNYRIYKNLICITIK